MDTGQQEVSWEKSPPYDACGRIYPLLKKSGIRQPANRDINVNLHGARGFFALLVFFFHVGASGVPYFTWQKVVPIRDVTLSLQLSVEIFFCISGYVVAGTLDRAHGPVAFLRNRALRILPLLWVTLAVVVPIGLVTHQGAFYGLSGRDLAWVFPGNMLPLAGAFPIPVLHQVTWSLSYELLFYLIAAMLWWLPDEQYVRRRAVMIVAAGLIIWHPRAVFFVVGVCVARTDIATQPWIRHATRSPGVMLVGFFTLWYWVQFGGAATEGTFFEWACDGRIGLAIVGIGFGMAAFAGIVAGQGWLGIVLRTTPLQRLGTLSFSFYLWHVIVIGVSKRALALTGGYALFEPWSQVVLAAVCLPASLLVAALSVRWIERDVSTWLRRGRLSTGFRP